MQVECCGTCKKLMITRDYQDGKTVVSIFCNHDNSDVEIFDRPCCEYKEFENSHEWMADKLGL